MTIRIVGTNDGGTDWAEEAKRVLRAEMKRRGVTYAGLAERLTKASRPETSRNISNKIGKGGFAASFFLECLPVLGCRTIHLDPDS